MATAGGAGQASRGASKGKQSWEATHTAQRRQALQSSVLGSDPCHYSLWGLKQVAASPPSLGFLKWGWQ